MKRLKIFIIIAAVLFLAINTVYSAGSISQTIAQVSKGCYEVTLACTGDASNGDVAATATTDNDANGKALNSVIIGKYLTQVKAFPTSGGMAPDLADVLIFDKHGLELLGSVDGATAYNGASLIHATLTRTCLPSIYLAGAGTHANYYPRITGALTVDVSNQGTVSANWTIVLVVEE